MISEGSGGGNTVRGSQQVAVARAQRRGTHAVSPRKEALETPGEAHFPPGRSNAPAAYVKTS